MDAADAARGDAVLAGGLWNVLGVTLPILYTFALSIAAARFLGPIDMGRQSFIAWTQLSVMTLLSAGLPVALLRYTAELRGRGEGGAIRSLAAWAFRWQVGAALIAGAIVALIGVGRDELPAAWGLAAVACGLGTLSALAGSLLRGSMRFRTPALIGLGGGLIGMAATVVVLARGGGIAGMFLIEAIVGAGILAITGAKATRLVNAPERQRPMPKELRSAVLDYSKVTMVRSLFHLVVWRRSELFFLDRFASTTQLALYSISFALSAAIAQAPRVLVQALAPAFATLHGAGQKERIESGFGRALRLSLTVSFPLSAGAIAVAPSFIRLVYGEDYADAGPLLVVLLIGLPIAPVTSVASALVQGVGKPSLLLRADIMATVANLMLAVLLIPRFGAVGAAVSNVGAQAVAGTLVTRAACSLVSHVAWDPLRLSRALVAGLGAGAGGLLGTWLIPSHLGILCGLLLGVLAYIVLVPLLRVFSSDDARWILQIIERWRGGRGQRISEPLAWWLGAKDELRRDDDQTTPEAKDR